MIAYGEIAVERQLFWTERVREVCNAGASLGSFHCGPTPIFLWWCAMNRESPREFIPLQVAILTVSDSRTEADDTSGTLLAGRVEQTGHRLHGRTIVKDDIYAIRAAVAAWIADPDCEVVICTGGTGITGRDGTPEAAAVLLDKEIEGFGEIFRAISYEEIGTSSLQSRCLAGVANGTYIFCLPGSPNACATAWDKLIALQLDFRTRPCNLAELMPRLKE